MEEKNTNNNLLSEEEIEKISGGKHFYIDYREAYCPKCKKVTVTAWCELYIMCCLTCRSYHDGRNVINW